MAFEFRQLFLTAAVASFAFAGAHAILFAGLFIPEVPLLLINAAHFIISISLFFIAGGLFSLLMKAKIGTGLPAGVLLIFTGILSLIGYNFCATPLVVFLVWAGWFLASCWTGISFFGTRQQIEIRSYISAILFILWGIVRVILEMNAIQAIQLGLFESSVNYFIVLFGFAIGVFVVTGYYFIQAWNSFP
jgi:hypothetical protein